MAVIYLKHERHGTKVATDEAEAVADEANGWERFSPGRGEQHEGANVVTLDQPRRPGRPRKAA